MLHGLGTPPSRALKLRCEWTHLRPRLAEHLDDAPVDGRRATREPDSTRE